MPKRDDFFFKIAAAALPLLPKTFRLQNGFFLGGLTATAFCLPLLFFSGTRACFPDKWREPAKVIWIAAMVQISQYLAATTPMWGLALWLLLPRPQETDAKGKFPRLDANKIWTGIGFWVLMIYLGAASQMLGGRMRLLIFLHPTGVFLLLGLAAFCWQYYSEQGKFA